MYKLSLESVRLEFNKFSFDYKEKKASYIYYNENFKLEVVKIQLTISLVNFK
jgi:hypothetical protein